MTGNGARALSLSRSIRAAIAALCLVILLPVAAPTVLAAKARPTAFADPAFETIWNRTDLPVDSQLVSRSWVWGPDAFHTGSEPYAQGPGGQHLVSYFDKSRMEINNPTADRSSQWFVTNGLLVVEMMSGRVQVGDGQFNALAPASLPVAGDSNAHPNTPTYASLARLATLRNDNRANNRVGQAVREGIGRTGGIAAVPNLSGYAQYGAYEPTTGHNIADVFWSFLVGSGPVYQDGQYTNDTLFDWVFVMGYPVTEPYWVVIRAGGQERWVLMQAFQRRILTYSPTNAEGWKVEMGNVGRAYYDWRYKQQASQPQPQPPAPPAPPSGPPASIILGAAGGSIDAPVRVIGSNFPPNTQVKLGVEKSTQGYYREVRTDTTDANGAFSERISLPEDAARLERVYITAITANGAVRAAQSYWIAALVPSSLEAANAGTYVVEGIGFVPNQAIRVGIRESKTEKLEWLTSVNSDGAGYFVAHIAIGRRDVGTLFTLIAEAPGAVFVESREEIRVIPLPRLTVEPSSGPPGVTVTVRGSGWPANRTVRVGREPVDSKDVAWLPEAVAIDASGNFAVSIYVGPEYEVKREARLVAREPVSNVWIEAPYAITR